MVLTLRWLAIVVTVVFTALAGALPATAQTAATPSRTIDDAAARPVETQRAPDPAALDPAALATQADLAARVRNIEQAVPAANVDRSSGAQSESPTAHIRDANTALTDAQVPLAATGPVPILNLDVRDDIADPCQGLLVDIPFAADTAELDESARTMLAELARLSKRCGQPLSLEVQAFGQTGADTARAGAIRRDRQDAVANALTAAGARIGQVLTPAFGETPGGAPMDGGVAEPGGVRLALRMTGAPPAAEPDRYEYGFNAPADGVVGQEVNVYLVIDATDTPNPTAFFDSLSAPGEIRVDTMPAAPTYTALLDGANFDVAPADGQQATRNVAPGGRVTWLWKVRPKLAGVHDLTLLVTPAAADSGAGPFDPIIRPINVAVAPIPPTPFHQRAMALLNWVNAFIAGLIALAGALALSRRKIVQAFRRLRGDSGGEGGEA